MIQTLRPRRVDVGGTGLEYVETGRAEGTPVVLLPGTADSWSSFAPTLDHLPRHLRVLALTLPGLRDGATPGSRPDGGSSADERADVVLAFLDRAQVAAAVVVGHSSGATTAQHLALRAPDRVLGLMLVGARPASADPRLARISVPTLLAWGDADDVASRAAQDTLLAAIPGSRLAVHPGVGHALHREMPARLALDIADLVATLPGSAPPPSTSGISTPPTRRMR